jgi:hypothetical protein
MVFGCRNRPEMPYVGELPMRHQVAIRSSSDCKLSQTAYDYMRYTERFVNDVETVVFLYEDIANGIWKNVTDLLSRLVLSVEQDSVYLGD